MRKGLIKLKEGLARRVQALVVEETEASVRFVVKTEREADFFLSVISNKLCRRGKTLSLIHI